MNGPALEEQRPGEVPEYTLRGGPLAASLSVLSSFHGVHASVDTLLAGLPLENGRLTPSLFSRAAERAGLLTRVVRTP
ncbi:MAG TPA: hypothetical protein PKY02_03775, partial [Synergistales bacterium]|nr:hypothetical protein [Synergistales bacterium]